MHVQEKSRMKIENGQNAHGNGLEFFGKWKMDGLVFQMGQHWPSPSFSLKSVNANNKFCSKWTSCGRECYEGMKFWRRRFLSHTTARNESFGNWKTDRFLLKDLRLSHPAAIVIQNFLRYQKIKSRVRKSVANSWKTETKQYPTALSVAIHTLFNWAIVVAPRLRLLLIYSNSVKLRIQIRGSRCWRHRLVLQSKNKKKAYVWLFS